MESMEYLITFRTVTPAQRGEGILKRAGYTCSLRRTPRWMESQGCGYSLRVVCGDIHRCIRKLQEQNVAFRKLYLQTTEGHFEEITI